MKSESPLWKSSSIEKWIKNNISSEINEGRAFLAASIAGTHWRNKRFQYWEKWPPMAQIMQNPWATARTSVLFQVRGKGTGRCWAERKRVTLAACTHLCRIGGMRRGKKLEGAVASPRHEVPGTRAVVLRDCESTEFWTHLDGLNERWEKENQRYLLSRSG